MPILIMLALARQAKANVDAVTIQQAQYELQVAEHNAKYHDNYQVKTYMGTGPWRTVHVVTPARKAH